MNKREWIALGSFMACCLALLSACGGNTDLPDLESAGSMEIGEQVGGLLRCDMLTFDKTYNLQRTPTQFNGQAVYEFASFVREGFTGTETLTIPQSVVQSFLVKLEKAQLKEGEYVQEPSCIDSSYTIWIRINLENSTVTFTNTDPCEVPNPPWNVEWTDKEDITYHIGPRIPLEALNILSPYLLPEADDKYWEKACSTTP